MAQCTKGKEDLCIHSHGKRCKCACGGVNHGRLATKEGTYIPKNKIKKAAVIKLGKRIKLQPKERPDMTLPYPFFIDEKGNVGRQDFWKGEPLKLVGFNPKHKTGVMKNTITFEMFMADHKLCVNKFPIFEHKDGNYYTYGEPIATWKEVD